MDYNFKGKWISNKDFYNADIINVFHRQLDTTFKEIKSIDENVHMLFRKTFNLGDFSNGLIHISADDFYKLYINSLFVGSGPSQGYTFDYHYDTFDITKYLKKGINTIAIECYYHGRATRAYVSGDNLAGVIFDCIVDKCVVCFSDESVKTINHSGYTSDFINKHNTQFIENYNFNSKENCFYKEEYDDSYWSHSYKNVNCNYNMTSTGLENLSYETIIPKIIEERSNGIFVDIGKEIIGYHKVIIKGDKNDIVTIKSGEELDSNGLPLYNLRCKVTYLEKYTLSGTIDTLSNFDYKGFRYLFIEGINIDILDISVIAIHYPFNQLNEFKYESDNTLKKVYELCFNTLKYGTLQGFIDCPTREKGQYFQDALFESLAYNSLTNNTILIRKLLDECYNSSFIDKGLMAVSPSSYMQEIAENSLLSPVLSYIYYKLTNDIESLKKDYEYIKDMLNVFKLRYERFDHLIGNMDKWNVVDWPEESRDRYDAIIKNREICYEYHNVINAYYIEAIKVFNEISKILGKEGVSYYSDLVNSYQNAFYNEELDLYVDNINSHHTAISSNVCALFLGIIKKNSTKDNIIKMIRNKKLNHSNVFISEIILFALYKEKEYDLLFDLIKDDDAWLNMIKEGATTTFEAFSKYKKKNTSLFHPVMAFPICFLVDYDLDKLFIKKED